MYGNEAQYAPPINNLLQPDIYNRLDAEAIERTRVVNTQLDERLKTQQRILAKYRIAAEKLHKREKARVQNELTRISAKMPAARRIRDFRNKFLYGDPEFERRKKMAAAKKRNRLNRPQRYGGDDGDGDEVGGVNEEDEEHAGGGGTGRRQKPVAWWDRAEQPFCERHFIHHLPTKSRYYKTRTPSPIPYFPVSEEAAAEAGGGGGRSPQEKHPTETPRSPTKTPSSENNNAPTLPVLVLPEGSADHRHHEQSIESAKTNVHSNRDHPKVDLMFTIPDVDSSMNGLHLEDLETDHFLSVKGENDPSFPRRKRSGRDAHSYSANGEAEGRQSVNGAETERAAFLPPIRKQNLRLSQSSPQLFHA